MCGRFWGGFVAVNLCCVWDRFLWDCGSECMLCVVQFGACLEIVGVCFVWENLERV